MSNVHNARNKGQAVSAAAKIEDVWSWFVADSETSGGRNNSMVGLFLRWRNASLHGEKAVEEAYRRFADQWPNNIDDDLYYQLERAEAKAEAFSQNHGGSANMLPAKAGYVAPAGKTAKPTPDSPKYREVALLLEAIGVSKRVTLKPPCLDGSPKTLGAFMARVLRKLHGPDTWCFLGKLEDAYGTSGAWYQTKQPTENPKDDKLISGLTTRFSRLEDSERWPAFLCNCSFVNPPANLNDLEQSDDEFRGRRTAEFYSKLNFFIVEIDKMLSTGKTPETTKEKEQAKHEQLRVANWLYDKIDLSPVLIVDSGNKSLHIYYLLDMEGVDRQDDKPLLKHLGELFDILDADKSNFAIPHPARAPQMLRDADKKTGGVQVLQRCLHFDEDAPRYRIKDVIQAMEKELEDQTVSSDGRAVTSPLNGLKGGRPRDVTPDALAEGFLDTHCRDENGQLTLRHYLGNWYAYDGHGWQLLPESELNSTIMGYLQEEAQASVDVKGGPVKTAPYTRLSVLENLKSNRLCALQQGRYPDTPFRISTEEYCPHLLACKNGILDMDAAVKVLKDQMDEAERTRRLGECLSPCTPDLFRVGALHYDFVPDATCPKFLSFLERIQPSADTRHILQMMFGWALSGSTKYQVGFILIGEGGTGKSTLLELLVAMMGGYGNVSTVSYEMFAQRFSLFPLTQHTLNVCNEMPEIHDNRDNASREAVLKSLCCGENYAVEEKGKPVVTRRMIARPIFATNKMPFISDKSEGVYRRLRLIPFQVCVTGDDVVRDIHRIIIDAGELPGILLWALHGWADLQELDTFPECEAGGDLLTYYREQFDPLGTFLKTHLELCPGAEVYADELEGKYREHMCFNDFQQPKAGAIKRYMHSLFPEITPKRGRSRNTWGGRVWYWEGIAFKEDD